jgi:hypothetical protein
MNSILNSDQKGGSDYSTVRSSIRFAFNEKFSSAPELAAPVTFLQRTGPQPQRG